MNLQEMKRRAWTGALGILLCTGLMACEKKDKSTTRAGGNVATQRSVLAMQGGAR